jgi:hypothetical protein
MIIGDCMTSRQMGHSPLLSRSFRFASTPSANALLPLPSDDVPSSFENRLIIESMSTSLSAGDESGRSSEESTRLG